MREHRDWTPFFRCRDPQPPVEPSVVLIGCRPFNPEIKSMDPKCNVCGGSIRLQDDGFYCGQCERYDPVGEVILETARKHTKVTPKPRRDPETGKPIQDDGDPEDESRETEDAEAAQEEEAPAIKPCPDPGVRGGLDVGAPTAARPTRRERRRLQFGERRDDRSVEDSGQGPGVDRCGRG